MTFARDSARDLCYLSDLHENEPHMWEHEITLMESIGQFRTRMTARATPSIHFSTLLIDLHLFSIRVNPDYPSEPLLVSTGSCPLAPPYRYSDAKSSRTEMKYFHLHSSVSPTFLLLPLLLINLITVGVHAHKAKENRRDFQKFDKDSLGRIANLAEQWDSVDEGHLKRLLIPRAGTSILPHLLA